MENKDGYEEVLMYLDEIQNKLDVSKNISMGAWLEGKSMLEKQDKLQEDIERIEEKLDRIVNYMESV